MIELQADVQTLVSEERAWTLLTALVARATAGEPVRRPCGVLLDSEGRVVTVTLGLGWIDVYPDAERCFRAPPTVMPSVARLLDLYLPLCIGTSSQRLVMGHVGQSLDGQIATTTGASRYVTGPQDLVHTHRLRALADAVIVGAETVAQDDPQLTTRLVRGANPTRVVIDPSLRTPFGRRLFHDGAARTLIVCEEGRTTSSAQRGRADVVAVRAEGGVLPPVSVISALRRRGLNRLFVEGGGVTVSRFLQARAFDRLHVTIGPCLLGRGRPGLVLPGIDRIDEGLRPRTRRFELGEDILFDCMFQEPVRGRRREDA